MASTYASQISRTAECIASALAVWPWERWKPGQYFGRNLLIGWWLFRGFEGMSLRSNMCMNQRCMQDYYDVYIKIPNRIPRCTVHCIVYTIWWYGATLSTGMIHQNGRWRKANKATKATNNTTKDAVEALPISHNKLTWHKLKAHSIPYCCSLGRRFIGGIEVGGLLTLL